MALNKNHEFEELNGIKCGIAEKNVSAERAEFLKRLLEFNKYEVVIVPSPAPKVAPPPKPAVQPAAYQPAADQPAVGSQQPTVSSQQPTVEQSQPQSEPQPSTLNPQPDPPPPPETFTVGVTDYTFNPINAIFGRMLKTPDGHFVTLAYWHQKENESHDEIPYYEQKL